MVVLSVVLMLSMIGLKVKKFMMVRIMLRMLVEKLLISILKLGWIFLFYRWFICLVIYVVIGFMIIVFRNIGMLVLMMMLMVVIVVIMLLCFL